MLSVVDVRSFAAHDLKNVYSAFDETLVILSAVLNSTGNSVVSLVSAANHAHLVYYSLFKKMPLSRRLEEVTGSSLY